jgi:exosortase N
MFRIGPEHAMHEPAGIICFVAYVMIPTYFFSRWIVVPVQKDVPSKQLSLTLPIYASLVLASLMLLLIGIRINVNRQQPVQVQRRASFVDGFRKEEMKEGITKFYNAEALVYVKPIPEFFTSEHTPLLCWKGTGYKFESIREIQVENHRTYVGRLVKGTKVLYTAWWYSNGETKTIDQVNWRFRMMKGEKSFSLINITSSSETDLWKNITLVSKLH